MEKSLVPMMSAPVGRGLFDTSSAHWGGGGMAPSNANTHCKERCYFKALVGIYNSAVDCIYRECKPPR